MTLVKTKTRVAPHHRKVGAGHHKKSQKYMKTYWPYLPIVLILGGALVANQYLPNNLASGSLAGASSSVRIESLMGVDSTYFHVMYVVLVLLVVWYSVRHFKRFKRILIDGEHFLARHYALDIFAAVLIGSLYILVH